MGESSTQARRSPGRPRNPEAERRILDAAVEEYLERGSAGFTMDGVARRAGIGKSAVYLRWPDRDALLVESVMARSSSIEDVDTGNLRDDLVQLAANLLRFLTNPLGFATFRIAVDAVANEAYRQVSQELAGRHRNATTRVFERAHARGDAINDGVVATVVECLFGAVSMQVLTAGLDPALRTDEEILEACERIVDLLYPALHRP
ncbi:TetR/AcrR family transcriptional regulator [Nocardioides panzhihuensis]|uniref:AcrR family transcriptional regulator n=1 Tax=Nocardioides panzhihuensis TaxID=860243 RepID=A0A7Z0DHP3_9ACTN|nr:TetR/AcrR family transcriptional regulator [Nocardioides panzhihuensis]NYI75493.1 AcrR family transcriptional regulator [Nocardioides panzhihuensis]